MGALAVGGRLTRRQRQQQQDTQRLIDRILESQREAQRLQQLQERLPYREIPIRYTMPTIPRAHRPMLTDQVLRRSTDNSVSQYLDYTIEEYHQLVGNNDTLRERFLAHVDYPINDPGQGYVPQELSSHRVELIMSERGLPTLTIWFRHKATALLT